MFLDVFVQLLPILLLILGGHLVNKIHRIEVNTLVKLVADFFMPLLIFHSLYYSDLQGTLVLGIAGATTLIVVLNTLFSYLYTRVAHIDPRGFMPGTIFMNSGFLGIPLMKLWGGAMAMNLIVMFDQIQTIYIFTLGIFIITGGISTKSLKTMMLSPILWAILLGFFVKLFQIPVWQPLLDTCEFGGNAGPPLATFALGVSLASTKLHFNRHILFAILLRVVGGFLFGYVGTLLFNITGLARTVVIVASSLPAAVFTSVLPLRYGVDSEYAGSIVILSTIAGIFTIPLAFMIAT
jgi:hypothetical protein